MASAFGKIIKVSDAKPAPSFEFKAGKYPEALDLKDFGSIEVRPENVIPSMLFEDPRSIRILEDSTETQAPSTVFNLNDNSFISQGRPMLSSVPKPAAFLLTAMGLGAFFLEPQIFSWLVSHLGSLLGMALLPMLGMAAGGGQRKEPHSLDSIERFLSYPEFVIEASQALETGGAEFRTLSFVGQTHQKGSPYHDEIITKGVVKRGSAKFKIEVVSGPYHWEEGEGGRSWVFGVQRPEDVAGYELFASNGRGDSETLNIITNDRITIELIHAQVAGEIMRTGSVKAAFDWLVNRSPLNPELFEISDQERAEIASQVPPEIREDRVMTELKSQALPSSSPTPDLLFWIEAKPREEVLEQILYGGEWWEFRESRKLESGQYEVSLSRPISLREGLTQTVYLSEENARRLDVLPGAKPQNIFHLKAVPRSNAYRIGDVLNRDEYLTRITNPRYVYAVYEKSRKLESGLYEVSFGYNKIAKDSASRRGFRTVSEKIILLLTRDEIIQFDLPSFPTMGRIYQLIPMENRRAATQQEFFESIPDPVQFEEARDDLGEFQGPLRNLLFFPVGKPSFSDRIFTRGNAIVEGERIKIDAVTRPFSQKENPDQVGGYTLTARENGKDYTLTINSVDQREVEWIHRHFVEKWSEVGSANYALHWLIHASPWDRRLFLSWQTHSFESQEKGK